MGVRWSRRASACRASAEAVHRQISAGASRHNPRTCTIAHVHAHVRTRNREPHPRTFFTIFYFRNVRNGCERRERKTRARLLNALERKIAACGPDWRRWRGACGAGTGGARGAPPPRRVPEKIQGRRPAPGPCGDAHESLIDSCTRAVPQGHRARARSIWFARIGALASPWPARAANQRAHRDSSIPQAYAHRRARSPVPAAQNS